MDIKRLAEVFNELLRVCDLGATDLLSLLEDEKRRIGLLPADLSPYAFFVQALARSNNVNFQKKFSRSHIKSRVIIHGGMDLPDWMATPHGRIINLDSGITI